MEKEQRFLEIVLYAEKAIYIEKNQPDGRERRPAIFLILQFFLASHLSRF